MYVQPLEAEDKDLLAAFVDQHPYGCVEQLFEWGQLQTSIPGRPTFRAFGLFEDTSELAAAAPKLVGSMLVIQQVMGAGKTWLWCPGGPLLPEGGEAEAWDLLRSACKNWARLNGDVFLRVESRQEGAVAGQPTKDRYLPQESLLLDLHLSEPALLDQMTQKGRYNIKQAVKNGVTVKKAGIKDAPHFYRLLKDTAVRDAFSVHQEPFYKSFLTLLGDRAEFYLASINGSPVAGLLATRCGTTTTYYFGASSSQDRESKAAYLLQWTAILDAKAAGCKTYDFLGVAPEGAAKHPLKGVTQFKTRFGGSRISYPPGQVFVFRPLWWLAYRLARFLKP